MQEKCGFVGLMSLRVWLGFCAASLAGCGGGGGSSSAEGGGAPPPPAVERIEIEHFSVSPSTVDYGGDVVFEWRVVAENTERDIRVRIDPQVGELSNLAGTWGLTNATMGSDYTLTVHEGVWDEKNPDYESRQSIRLTVPVASMPLGLLDVVDDALAVWRIESLDVELRAHDAMDAGLRPYLQPIVRGLLANFGDRFDYVHLVGNSEQDTYGPGGVARYPEYAAVSEILYVPEHGTGWARDEAPTELQAGFGARKLRQIIFYPLRPNFARTASHEAMHAYMATHGGFSSLHGHLGGFDGSTLEVLSEDQYAAKDFMTNRAPATRPLAPMELYLAGLVGAGEVPLAWVGLDGEFLCSNAELSIDDAACPGRREHSEGSLVFRATDVLRDWSLADGWALWAARRERREEWLKVAGAGWAFDQERSPNPSEAPRSLRSLVALLVDGRYEALRHVAQALAREVGEWGFSGASSMAPEWSWHAVTGARSSMETQGLDAARETVPPSWSPYPARATVDAEMARRPRIAKCALDARGNWISVRRDESDNGNAGKI